VLAASTDATVPA